MTGGYALQEKCMSAALTTRLISRIEAGMYTVAKIMVVLNMRSDCLAMNGEMRSDMYVAA